jgi:glycosyltransferase 2 family protein
VLRKVSWRALGTILERVDFRWVLSGWALTFLVIAILAFRWNLFLRQQEVDVPFSEIFRLTWAGQFFNSILPGSTGGDVVKIYQLCRLLPEKKAAVAASVLADRLTALVILVGLAGASFLLKPIPLELVSHGGIGPQSIILVVAGLLVAGAVVGWLLWLFLRRTGFAARIHRVLAGIRQCLSLNVRLLAAFALALVLHLLNFSIVFLFARSLGLTITYGQTLLMMPVILFLVMAPVTINGHGLREVLLIAYLGAMNITIARHPEFKTFDTAVALSLLTVANDLTWSLPGGAWYLLRLRVSREQTLRNKDASPG